MIFNFTKKFVPESYSDSRDYRVLLKLLGVIMSTIKYNIDHFIDLYNPDECPDNLLNFLGNMVGYKYQDHLKTDSNRKIIKYFPYLIRNRGSLVGLKLAIALSTDTNSSYVSLEDVNISFDYENGKILIYYPRGFSLNKEIIDAVRPAGMYYELIPSDNMTTTEDLRVYNKARFITDDYGHTDKVGSQVDFSSIEHKEE